jgi:GTP-binding protein HflX
MSARLARDTRRARERVLVCGVLLPGQKEEAGGPLTELRALLEAAGADPIGAGIVQRSAAPQPATLMGSGKVAEVAREIGLESPDAVAVDNDLSPAQIRNLEKAWGVRVLDRSEVILDIFARRARTSQARLQVQLAQAEYLLPRLRRMWTHLERTEGAVGTRGPGETQLETDKRLLKRQIQDLRRRLREIEARKRREVRTRAEHFTVGLIGYTNAGKSSLLNRLTGADELAADLLFATLDTRTRQWRLSDGRTVLLSDTVGFLQRLPHHLVASFHATLEEALHADLLLHVADASHADAPNQIAAVEEVLASQTSRKDHVVLVLNKIDKISAPLAVAMLQRSHAGPIVRISAKTGAGLDELDQVVRARLDEHCALVELRLPLADGRLAAEVRRLGALVSESTIEDRELRLVARLSEAALGNLRRLALPPARLRILAAPSAAPAQEAAPPEREPAAASAPIAPTEAARAGFRPAIPTDSPGH